MPDDWMTIAPIGHVWRPENAGDLPAAFESSVKLDWLPVWVKDEQFLNMLSWTVRDEIDSEGRYCLLAEYQASVDGEVDPTSPFPSITHKQGVAAEKLRHVNIALWLAAPTALGFRAIIDASRPKGQDWSCRGVTSCPGVEPLGDYRLAQHDSAALSRAKSLYPALRDLSRDNSVWRAVRTLWSALTSPSLETRYILIWIGLESLFGPSSGQEVSFRIAQRISLFLRDDRVDRAECFKAVRSAYTMRSKVVHGRALKKISPEKAEDQAINSEAYLREAITKLLEEPSLLVEFTDEKCRDAYLDGLALG